MRIKSKLKSGENLINQKHGSKVNDYDFLLRASIYFSLVYLKLYKITKWSLNQLDPLIKSLLKIIFFILQKYFEFKNYFWTVLTASLLQRKFLVYPNLPDTYLFEHIKLSAKTKDWIVNLLKQRYFDYFSREKNKNVKLC